MPLNEDGIWEGALPRPAGVKARPKFARVFGEQARDVVKQGPIMKLGREVIEKVLAPVKVQGAVVGVKPLNLDGVLGKPKNRVALIGLELEGGWKRNPENHPVVRDGSVFKDSDAGGLARGKYPNHLCGEVGLGPIPVGLSTPLIRIAWPTVTDKSCGMHIHMSFETVFQYMVLADSPVYQETVMEYLRRWAEEEGFPGKDPIWARLHGKNEYCQPKFWPMAQMEWAKKDHDKERFGHRYTAIHYCWERFRTVECRLLPMMATAEQGIRAVRRVIDITNAYLLLAEKKKIKEEGKVEIGGHLGGEIREERGKNSVRIVFHNGDVYEEHVDVKL